LLSRLARKRGDDGVVGARRRAALESSADDGGGKPAHHTRTHKFPTAHPRAFAPLFTSHIGSSLSSRGKSFEERWSSRKHRATRHENQQFISSPRRLCF
jgi:hypothetical protein